MVAITTQAKVKAAFNISVADKDALITELIAQVGAWVASYTGRNFDGENVTELTQSPGHGATELVLNKFPTSSVTSVHVSCDVPRVYDATTLLTAGEDYLVDSDAGILHRVDGSAWPTPPQSVRVIYVVAFAGGAVPGDVERAAIEVIGVKLEKGWSNAYHITSKDLGDGGLMGIRFDDIPPSAREVFDRYRRAA